MTVKETLEYDKENGSLIFGIAVSNKLCDVVGQMGAYAGICGSYYDGVHQWMTHNVDGIDEVSNEKYTGYIIYTESGEHKLYIENRIMNLEVNDWKHAKNLFVKYLKKK